MSTVHDHLPLDRSARVRGDDGALSNPEPLSHYSGVHAWVLIADPGAGKTDVFKTLSEAEGGYYTKARDFVELNLPPGWTPPLFIDGLDEMTAGTAAGSTALGQIRVKLQTLGAPKFRISCREADWRGNTDSAALQRLVGLNNVLELHLEPLNRSQTIALIAYWQQSDEAAAEDFIQEAENRDLEGLLDNPQTLRMLIKAVATTGSGWPGSKTQTYEMACAQLVREHNEEWLAATRNSSLSDDKVLQAAGYLSAIMLLSGSAKIAVQRHADIQPGIVAMPELVSGADAPDMTTCQAALRTRLFRGVGGGNFEPVHRTVAEYLGAQYLISRIRAGLPASRVLALMLGLDAGVVPELRGLHAWLAATAPTELRRKLIDHDPLGVVLNGDVRNFSRVEKLRVLNALRDEARRYTYFRSQNWASNPFGALATVDMLEDFKAWFQSGDRSPTHQALVDCLLDALANGHHMPELVPELERVVRDKTYWPGSRAEALGILVVYARDNDDWSTLTQLLADVEGNVVEDLEDELLGRLLQALYPTLIPPAKIWRYFRKPKADHLLGSYWQFWHVLSKDSAMLGNIPDLLDALIETGHQLSDEGDHLGLSNLVGDLLVAGVTQHGGEIDVQRLYRWLSMGLGPHHFSALDEEHKAALARWLSERPTLYKALFEHGLHIQANPTETGFDKLWRIRAQLYGAEEPDDAELWYLSLAGESTAADVRRLLVNESFNSASQKRGIDAAIRLLEEWSADHSNDAAWVEAQLRCAYPPPESDQKYINSAIARKQRAAEASLQRIDFFRKTLPSFALGPAHLGALVEVANAYLDFFRHNKQRSPDARLRELLNQNGEWVRLALHGLRQCLLRDDLPSAAKIIDLNVKGSRYNLAAPCLAAMELHYAEDPQSVLKLPPAILETAVAFRLTNSFGNTPAWFKQLLAQRPATLAAVMERLISQQIASGKEYIDGLYALVRDADYAEIAKQIAPRLIAEFPRKASKKQLKTLRLLIVAMLDRLEGDFRLELIAKKLSTAGMDVAQHVYWLTAGLLLAPNQYLESTKQFVQKTQVRVSHLFAMIQERQERGSWLVNLPAATQAFLIELLGPGSRPSWSKGAAGWVTPEMEMGRNVEALISALAANPDDAATTALTVLQQRQDLKQWGDSLTRAIYDQRVTRRKALFEPASVAEVCATLASLKPANAADLWALTLDYLTKLAHEIRDGNTNDYRQYWAGANPKKEDDCRDALLSDLKRDLAAVGVSAEPEGRYADEKRADIKVIAPPHHIPIEVKRETHRDVWKAIPEQLIAKYGRELFASDGYGIYLVFWFTGNLNSAPSDGGSKPKTPQELQERLAATVPEELRHKIAVLVVDCSKKTQAQAA